MAATEVTPEATFDEFVFRRLPLAAMLGFAMAGFVFGSGWSERAAAWPWLVSLLVVGLPHGAADLTVTRRRLRGGAVLGLAAAYMAVMAVAAAALTVAPAATIGGFAVLSGWHFGAAHAESQLLEDGRFSPGLLWLAAVARGGVVLGVPLATRPEATAEVVASVARLTGAAVFCTPDFVRMLGLCLVAGSCLALGIEALVMRGRPAALRRTRAAAGDLVVIGLLGLATDPLFAVGVYFLCWHAWRQMRPLAAAIGGPAPHDPRSLALALAAIHRAALPLLVPTWGALAALEWLLPEARLAHSARGLAILSLAIYVVVTPSHDLLTDWWRSRGARSRNAGTGGLQACHARSACCSP